MASRLVARNIALSDSLKISFERERQYTLLHQIINFIFYCKLRYLFPNDFQLTYDPTQNICLDLSMKYTLQFPGV